MPLDESFVGRVYPPGEPYRVGREKIREFADAIGDPNPAYRSAEAARALGHRDVVAPPTFPILLAMAAGRQLIDDPEARIDYSHVVHADQGFTFERAICAGDRLTVTLVIDGVRLAGGRRIVDERAEIRDGDGELVATARTSIVVGAAAAAEAAAGEN